jgi:peptidyl-prolyl cis-trans isomerase A (cyclophilin A)/peptidyl-prolyl cis-trans isomerase B (cyclophilin B)
MLLVDLGAQSVNRDIDIVSQHGEYEPSLSPKNPNQEGGQLDRALTIALFFSISAATTASDALAQVEVRTNVGTFRIELYPDRAPKTVQNFLQYVHDGHYNGTLFHRVIDGFMIQGGGYDMSYAQKPTRAPIENEAQTASIAGLKNEAGTVAMARTRDPNSATSQFFINVGNNTSLDWGNPRGDGNGYVVFGKVISGIDVVMRIAKSPTGSGGPFQRDVPIPQIVIESIGGDGIASSREPGLSDEQFAQIAATYRGTSPKPNITEEVRKLKVQAEFMIREKRFRDAASLYNEALKIAPWWAVGRYNHALVLAELKRYRDAISEMKRFLQLEPNSPEARAIQDQMYQWDAAAMPAR